MNNWSEIFSTDKKNIFSGVCKSLKTGIRIFHFLHVQFGHSCNLYRSVIKNIRGVWMFGVSLLGRLCSYTDNPLMSGFHVESVFY